MPTRITVMSDSDCSPQRDDRHHCRSRSRSPVSPGCAGETLAEREERRLAEAAVPVEPPAGQPQTASADTGPSTRGPAPAEETAPAAQAAIPTAPPPHGASGAQTLRLRPQQAAPRPRPWPPARRQRGGWPRRRAQAPRRVPPRPQRKAGRGHKELKTAAPASRATAPAGHTAAPGTLRALRTDPARAPGASPGPSAAAAGDREGAKYPAHTNPSHIHTSPPKPYSPKAAFSAGRTRHIRPPAPKRMPPGVTLPQLRRQQDARRVIREGGGSAQVGKGAGHGSTERRTGGDRGSAQGQTQGAGLGAYGKERGRRRGHGTEASGSGGGQSAGSGRHDAGQGAVKGQGHGKDTQGREQGAKAGGHGAHGVEPGAVGERGCSQGHGHGHGRDTIAGSAAQGADDGGGDPRRGQGDKGVGAGKGPKGKGKGAVGPQGQTGRGAGAKGGWRS